MTKLSDLKAGDIVEIDDGFICMPAGRTTVMSDESGVLYVRCDAGYHTLDGCIDDLHDDDRLIGVTKVEGEPT